MLFQRSARLFCRKNVAKELQFEKIGKKPKKSEDQVKSRVTPISMLPWVFGLQRFHFASIHFWLESTENIVDFSAIGKKLIEKTQKSFFSAQ